VALDGITPILATSYDERGRVAHDDIARQVEHLAGLPVAAVGIGFGSDIVRLTEAERDGLIRAACETAAGRVRVLASAGGHSVRSALDRAEAAVRAGASILMVVPPGASSAPTIADLVDYYAAIAAETGVPVMVQDAPGFTGTTMSAELLARLGRELPGVEAVKIETVPPAPKVGAVAALDHGGAAVLGGAGGLDFYHELERGADGTVPGSGLAELFLEVQRLHRGGERDVARHLFNRYLPILSIPNRGLDAFFAAQLRILERRGLVRSTRLRPPANVDPLLAGEVDTLFDDLEIGGKDWTPTGS
jgi:2-keto-3-deoxy-L-arabinonate dehydratase